MREQASPIVAALAVFAAAVVVAGAAAPATAGVSSRPVVVRLTVTPTMLSAAGGVVTVTAHVAGAKICSFDEPATLLYPSSSTVSCAKGSARTVWQLPASPGSRYSFDVVAHNRYGSTRSKFITVSQATTTTTTTTTTTASVPPVVDLDTCSPGPDCDYGPIYDTFQNYGNTAPTVLGDCTFAAAANWEQILFNVTPDPTLIGFEFAQAGGTTSGLPQNDLWTYWEHSGIAGYVQTGLHSYYTDQTDVQNSVLNYAAMIAQLQFVPNDGFAQYTVPAGYHDVVVDGFTPEGPLVVTWGQTLQMTWAQWTTEVVRMWGIGARPAG